jgi:hypothetical protein
MRAVRFAKSLLIAAAVLLSFSSAPAQSINEAGLWGTVTDASGAVIPRAHVTLTDIATNLAHNAVSDNRGAYTFRALPPATYKMLVEEWGFWRRGAGQHHAHGQSASDTQCDASSCRVASNVTVSAVPVLLESDDATLGTDVGSKYLLQIPLANRDPFGLTFLAGGVTETTSSAFQIHTRPARTSLL